MSLSRAVLLTLVASLLASCSHDLLRGDPQEPLAVRLDRTYGERCALAGLERGTPQYGRCLLAARDAEKEDQSRRAAAAAAAIAAGAQAMQRPMIQPVQPARQPVTCTSFVNGTYVTTNCYSI